MLQRLPMVQDTRPAFFQHQIALQVVDHYGLVPARKGGGHQALGGVGFGFPRENSQFHKRKERMGSNKRRAAPLFAFVLAPKRPQNTP